MQRKVAEPEVKTQHADQQGAQTEVWGRESLQVNISKYFKIFKIFSNTTRFSNLNIFQSGHKQEDEGDGGAGAELRQLQPAAVEGAARRAHQLC